MKSVILTALCCLSVRWAALAQELYINTEPASNMAARSIGFRMNNYGYSDDNGKTKTIFNPEIMYGFSSQLMVHAEAYIDDKFTDGYVFRGLGLYAKYRFLNIDGVHKHFRVAAFSRFSDAFQPDENNEVSIIDDYRGISAGIIATQLLHKLAISSTIAYTRAFGTANDYIKNGDAVEYSLSFGDLALPRLYTSYKQTNMNLFFEILGKNQWANVNINPSTQKGYYLDAAPGIQFVIRSRALIDLSWRWQVVGDMDRLWYQQAFVRLEYNIFNL